MTKRDWLRFWLHFPVGMVAGWLTFIAPTAGVMFSVWFIAYQVMGDWRKQDNSYKDIYGAVFGYGIITGILSLL